MKRLLFLLLTMIVVCSTLVVPAAATQDYVISPEYNEEIEIPDEEIPLDPSTTSPQTGYEMGIVGLAAVAVLCGAAAVFSCKKAFQN